MSTRYKHDVFISYSRHDTEIADKICKAFDRAGVSYFIDRQGIGGGMEFPAILARAIRESKIFLFLASENSYKSKFTIREVTFAFNKKDENSLLPYIIDDSTLPEDLELVFSGINRRTITEHPIDTILVKDILELLGDNETKSEETNSNQKIHVNHDNKVHINKNILVIASIIIAVFIVSLSAKYLIARQPQKEIASINFDSIAQVRIQEAMVIKEGADTIIQNHPDEYLDEYLYPKVEDIYKKALVKLDDALADKDSLDTRVTSTAMQQQALIKEQLLTIYNTLAEGAEYVLEFRTRADAIKPLIEDLLDYQ